MLAGAIAKTVIASKQNYESSKFCLLSLVLLLPTVFTSLFYILTYRVGCSPCPPLAPP